MSQPDPLTLTARWVFPADTAPLPGGRVTVVGGRVAAVEPEFGRAADVDLGNVAILPGLVNAHTHLDLCGLRGRCPPSPDFTGWLRQVIAHRRATPPGRTEDDIRAGLAESLRYGTTLLGDIASGGASWDVLVNAPLRSVVFLELLGLTEGRARHAEDTARAWLSSQTPTATCRPGLSPHGPYSVRGSLFDSAAALAAAADCPLAVHLAESPEEAELLDHQRGSFVAFLKELGVWDPAGLCAGAADVMSRCDVGVPKLFVHANHLAPSARIPRRSTVVYCPRTHAAFGHPRHPFRDFLARGVRVALGTDGLASNPDLDVLAEARFLSRQHPDLPGDVLLRMATLWGAEALGWEDETGSLTPGKSADLVTVPLPDDGESDPYRLLFGDYEGPRKVMVAGAWVAG